MAPTEKSILMGILHGKRIVGRSLPERPRLFISPDSGPRKICCAADRLHFSYLTFHGCGSHAETARTSAPLRVISHSVDVNAGQFDVAREVREVVPSRVTQRDEHEHKHDKGGVGGFVP
jgi:hypothetical protein